MKDRLLQSSAITSATPDEPRNRGSFARYGLRIGSAAAFALMLAATPLTIDSGSVTPLQAAAEGRGADIWTQDGNNNGNGNNNHNNRNNGWWNEGGHNERGECGEHNEKGECGNAGWWGNEEGGNENGQNNESGENGERNEFGNEEGGDQNGENNEFGDLGGENEVGELGESGEGNDEFGDIGGENEVGEWGDEWGEEGGG